MWDQHQKSLLTHYNFFFRLAQSVKLMISMGILLTYALQFYVPVDVMWPWVANRFDGLKHPIFAEMIFRLLLVLLTCEYAYLGYVLTLACSAMTLHWRRATNLCVMLSMTSILISINFCFCSHSGGGNSLSSTLYFSCWGCEQYRISSFIPTDASPRYFI